MTETVAPTVEATTVSRHRPRADGANIRTWIGFRHFLAIVEEAVLDWLREHAVGARELYHRHGLAVELVDVSMQLPAVLELDDLVTSRVEPRGPGRLGVTLTVAREGRDVVVARAKVTLALVAAPEPPAAEPLPVALADLLGPPLDTIGAGVPAPSPGPGGFAWSWRAGYPTCHVSDRVQHAAYGRALEEVVDRFLESRGLSVARLLADRGWIPVVSRVRLRLHGVARMEETVRTSFAVTDVLRDTMFDGEMVCDVGRDGDRRVVATAQILHGYAASRGPGAGALATLDADVVAALTGGAA